MHVRVVKPRAWLRLSDGVPGAVEEAVAELVRYGSRASVFACDSRAAIELVAVAFSALRRNAQAFHFISITARDLGAANVEAVRSEGRTPLPGANRLHRDLDLSGDRARLLVEHLARRGVEVETVSERELRRLARALHAAGQPVPVDSWLLR
jgi:hypothetical protein